MTDHIRRWSVPNAAEPQPKAGGCLVCAGPLVLVPEQLFAGAPGGFEIRRRLQICPTKQNSGRRSYYFFGPKNAIIPSRTVGWLLELPSAFWKNGWFDQSLRSSSRLNSQSVILYSPALVSGKVLCEIR